MIALFALPVSTAIAQDSSYHEYYEDAVRRFNEGDTAGASVQVKNALLENPEHLPARILLGKVYLREGRGEDAETELKRALKLGAARDQALPPLGDALLLQGKYSQLLDELVPDSPQLRRTAGIYTLRGRAYYHLGDTQKAREAFEQARSLGPAEAGPLLGLATLAARQNQVEEALTLIAAARSLEPGSVEVWYQTGDVLRSSGQLDEALEAYARALELNPDHMRTRLSRARLYLALSEFQLALDDAVHAWELQAYDPEPPFLASQALARLGRDEEAAQALDEASGRIQQMRSDHLNKTPALLRIAAMVSYVQGNTEQANNYLELYVQQSPYDVEMRKVLANVKLRLGDTDGAVEALSTLYRTGFREPELLYMLGDALLRAGRYGEALVVLEQVLEDNADHGRALTRIALGRIGLGESDAALDDLRKALSRPDQPGAIEAGVILTTVYIRQGKTAEALDVALALAEQFPQNPMLQNLLGTAYLAADDSGRAYTAFGQARTLSKDYTPALYNLAMLETGRDNLEAAESLYKEALAKDPEAQRALIGLSDIAIRRGDNQAAIALLRKVVDQDDGVIGTEEYVQLINLYLASGEPDKALIEAETLKRRYPESSTAHVLLARVHETLGDEEAAREAYRKAYWYSGMSGADLLHIAAAQQRLGDVEGALKSLTWAARTELGLEARAAMVSLFVSSGDTAKALEAADAVVAELPKSHVGHLLRGDALLAAKRYQEALAAYGKSGELQESQDAVMGKYTALAYDGKATEARATLSAWLEKHPDDAHVRRNLAIAYITAGDKRAARTEFERLYEAGERSPVVLTHLARLYQMEGDERARDYARQAFEANPTWSVAIDTYGWILVTEGELENGLNYLRDAVARDSSPVMRYHLAATLAELGRQSEAKLELRKLADVEMPPALQAAVESLGDRLEGVE